MNRYPLQYLYFLHEQLHQLIYLQQKLNPTPPDPIQAKIFMFFPLFLTIILAPFPSGLVVYWTINNILTIAQQWVIYRSTTVKTK